MIKYIKNMFGEDWMCVALLFCSTFGVGSMNFGAIFATSGPYVALCAIFFLSALNMHASIAVSKVMQEVPSNIKTFSDLGSYALGETGRVVVLISEAAVCFLTPIAFLILGGTMLLPVIFEHIVFGQHASQWIICMGFTVFPIILIPTLKKATILCYIGGIVAIIADSIAILYSIIELPYSAHQTELHTETVAHTFGTIMFAVGTAIIIPPIQRQHSDPQRMIQLVPLTLLIITFLYVLVGMVTYYQFGCTAPETLLDQIPPGFIKRIACAFMLTHMLVAYPLTLQPMLYDLERYFLDIDTEQIDSQHHIMSLDKLHCAPTIYSIAPSADLLDADVHIYGNDSSTSPYVEATNSLVHENSPYFQQLWSSLIRLTLLSCQTVMAVTLQGSFLDVLSFIGASAITVSCMIMPCLCYLQVMAFENNTWRGKADRILCYITIIVSSLLGIYCTYLAGRNICQNFTRYRLFQPMVPIKAYHNTTIGINANIRSSPYCIRGN